MNSTLPDSSSCIACGSEDEPHLLLKLAANGDRGAVEGLLNQGTEPNLRDSIGSTALMRAVNLVHSEVVELLLERGADPKLRDSTGRTLLHYAVYSGDVEMVLVVLKLGIDPNTKDDGNRSPLTVAVLNGITGPVRALLACGANPNENNWLSGEISALLESKTGLTLATEGLH